MIGGPAPQHVTVRTMGRPTLTDTSPDGFRTAIETDIVATRLYNQDVPLEAHEEPDVAWSVPAAGSEMRPIVAWCNRRAAGSSSPPRLRQAFLYRGLARQQAT